MQIGVPKEIKNHEYRVGLLPSIVRELTEKGHQVFVETQAGAGIGMSDADYAAAGATVLPQARQVFESAQLIVKVKEPQLSECAYLNKDHVLFTYLHLAADPAQAEALQASGCTAIAYETVTDASGGLPLLTPMSEIAGRLAVQAGARSLEKASGGRGILLGGVPGVSPANVLVIGGGAVGTQAIKMALGLEAQVTLLERSIPVLSRIKDQFPQVHTCFSDSAALAEKLAEADLVIGAVLIPGDAAPKLIKRSHLAQMKPGAVFVDVSIDQGGVAETSRPTTYADPIYTEEGIVHYCVANMPGGVPLTATRALNNATNPFLMEMVSKGVVRACAENPHLREGINVMSGEITHESVASALGKSAVSPETLLSK